MVEPQSNVDPDLNPGAASGSRRAFLLAGLGVLLAGCEAPQAQKDWEPQPIPPAPTYDPPVVTGRSPAPSPTPGPSGVIVRTSWAKGDPVPSRMNRMTPIRYVTVHHDGMQPFYSESYAATAGRLESIRRAHRGKPEPWGDIGYHYAVDRRGRVWACRPIMYQGAHVKNHNEGNIGIVCLGNFERQPPSPAQLEALRRHIAALKGMHGISDDRVRTHQEWAATLCPGRSLQPHVDQWRRSRQLA